MLCAGNGNGLYQTANYFFRFCYAQALETDLTKLFELAQETISDTYKLVLKSPVGLLFPRRGGACGDLIISQ